MFDVLFTVKEAIDDCEAKVAGPVTGAGHESNALAITARAEYFVDLMHRGFISRDMLRSIREHYIAKLERNFL